MKEYKSKLNLADSSYPTVQIMQDTLLNCKSCEDIYFVANQSYEVINNWLKLNRCESYIKGKDYMNIPIFAFRNNDDLKIFVDVIRTCNFKISNLLELIDMTQTLFLLIVMSGILQLKVEWILIKKVY